MSFGKLIVHPTLVFAAGSAVRPARPAAGDRGALRALPTGADVLLFATRYDALRAETTATTVLSTTAFVVTATGWLIVLSPAVMTSSERD